MLTFTLAIPLEKSRIDNAYRHEWPPSIDGQTHVGLVPRVKCLWWNYMMNIEVTKQQPATKD